MQVQVQKWGENLAICIPDSFASEIKANQGSFLELSSIGKSLVLTPVTEKKYSLDGLLDQMMDENLHHEIDFGNEAGREIW
jgi:antitoxin MazE